MSDPTLWSEYKEIVAAIVGVCAGYLLSELKDWSLRGRRHKALWQALSAEIDSCKTRADTYLKDNVVAPLYRLPTIAYVNCLPLLLSDGTLTGAESQVLTEFFAEVETLNRGLDYASAARDKNDNAKLMEEFNRNRIKAERIAGNGNLYAAAIAITQKHTGKCSQCRGLSS